MLSPVLAQEVVMSAPETDRATAALAREQCSTFIEYVMRDEHTGAQVWQTRMHEEWHELCDQYDRLIIWSHTEAGKTFQLSIGRVLWLLGRNPSLRIAICSNTAGQAVKIIRSIAAYVEKSAELHRVFPNLVPSTPWTTTQLTVRRPHISKDPSVQATGVHGNILGSRVDVLIIDDILDIENTSTPDQRKKLEAWVRATPMGRLTENSKVVIVGNAFHPDDILHNLAQEGWTARTYPVVDMNGNTLWPARWPPARVAQARRDRGSAEFARQMMCVARDDLTAIFKQDWINIALSKGRGRDPWIAGVDLTAHPGYRTYTGVDLAVQKHAGADWTVFFTILVWPDGTREVLECNAGHWHGPEIVDRIIDVHYRFQSTVLVENNAAQDFILHFLRQKGISIPVRGFTTGANKANPDIGVEHIATEMENGRWVIPNTNGMVSEDVDVWIKEMLYYSKLEHTGDRLMASWFAMSAAMQGAQRIETGTLNTWTR